MILDLWEYKKWNVFDLNINESPNNIMSWNNSCNSVIYRCCLKEFYLNYFVFIIKLMYNFKLHYVQKICNPLIIWLLLTMIEQSFVNEKHLCDGPLKSCVGTFNVICHITVWYKNILQFKIIHQKNIFFIDHIVRTSVPVCRHAIIGYASMGHYTIHLNQMINKHLDINIVFI